MGASTLRARTLLRRNLRTTIALTLIAGIVGGLALTAWSSARRGVSSLDRFLAATGEPAASVGFCKPDARGNCQSYDPVAETAEIRSLPGVDAAARGVLVQGTFRVPGADVAGPVAVLIGDGLTSFAGDPVVVAGRRADPARANEIVVPEEAARLFDVAVGDVVPFTKNRSNETPGETVGLRVVGLVRTTNDLAAGLDPGARDLAEAMPYAGPAFWERYGRDSEFYGLGVLVRTSDRTERGLDGALRARFGEGNYTLEQLRRPATEQNVRDAVRYESTALVVVALAVALSWLVFVGQALVRQSAREHREVRTLVAIGMTRGQRVTAAVLRAAPVAVGTALIAGIICVLGSPATPLGRARRAEVDHGMYVDSFVLLVGAAALVAAVVAFLCCWAVFSPRGRRAGGSTRTAVLEDRLPLIAVAGVRLVTSARRRSLALRAGAATAVAVAVAVAGLGLVDSVRWLAARPRSYGTSWNALVIGKSPDTTVHSRLAEALAALRADPEVRAVGALEFNTAAIVDSKHVNVVGAWTLYGPDQAWVNVTKGRAPRGEREVALGPKTRRALGAELGDVVVLEWFGAQSKPEGLKVVGEALLYDGSVMGPGEGAVVDARRFGPRDEREEESLVVRTSSAQPDLPKVAAAGFERIVPPSPPGVRNLLLVDGAPGVIAVLVGLLAFAALAHTMLSVIGRERRQIAVLRVLGATRGQLEETLASGGLAIVIVGAGIGVPAGLVIQRAIWSRLEANVGFSSRWFASWWPIAIVAVALLVAPLLGALQARILARQPPATALRAE